MFKLNVGIWIEPSDNDGDIAWGNIHLNQQVSVILPGFAEVGEAMERFYNLAREIGSEHA